MDFLATALLVLFVIFLIAILVIFFKLRARETRPQASAAESEGPTVPPKSQSRAASDNLDSMRLAVEQMETDHIENMLDMGATLRPGAEEIFRAELAKRRQAGDDTAG